MRIPQTIDIDTRQYLQLIYRHPTIRWKALEHWDEELETARPMPNQQHHTDQVEDPHKHTRHVQKLK